MTVESISHVSAVTESLVPPPDPQLNASLVLVLNQESFSSLYI